MRFSPLLTCAVLLLLATASRAAEGAFKLELRDGDRVAFLGGALIEHEQEGGYIETMLTTRFPHQNITFRNLGYSGDTVSGDARGLCTGWSTFESPEQGLNRLRKIFREISPTVLIANYGMNESFNGPEKLADFVAGYNKLLDILEADAKGNGSASGLRQVVLLSPNFHEDLGRPLPDPADHNRNLKFYGNAIEELAQKRKCAYIDLYSITEQLGNTAPLTSNGIHLLPDGYWRLAQALGDAFELPAIKVTGDSEGEFLASAPPMPGGEMPARERSHNVKFVGLASGTYELTVNGRKLSRASAQEWAQGVSVPALPPDPEMEKLRQLIVAKNFDFFNYWRPENDSYILSFRKKEQGQNAVELPRFKPVVEAKEAEIAKLRTESVLKYKLARMGD
jgi:lysophospholipase L1-like esterase